MTWQPDYRDNWPEWVAPDELTEVGVGRVLGLLASGRIHPEMAAAWALRWDTATAPTGTIRWGLERLVLAVKRLTASQYQYSAGDYKAWREQYTAMIAGSGTPVW